LSTCGLIDSLLDSMQGPLAMATFAADVLNAE
jgi:hypothetical protein